MKLDKLISDLQLWYKAQCDGDWEHQYGISIDTLDNPGWVVKIDTCRTLLENKPFEEISVNEHEDWIECRLENNQFIGYGDPNKLMNILEIFIKWAQEEKDWLSQALPLTKQDMDAEFFINLGEEIGPTTCKYAGCKRKHILNSVMCQVHHFEMVKGYPPPKGLSRNK